MATSPLKYFILILSGAADAAIPELDGLTPLAVAETPALDVLARSGRLGTVCTVPDHIEPDPDIALASLLGIDPRLHRISASALEAASLGVEIGEKQWVLRCSLVSADDEGRLLDHAAGRIAPAECALLMEALAAEMSARLGESVVGLEFMPGLGTGGLLIDRLGRDFEGLESRPPEALLGKPVEKHLPRGGKSAALLREIMSISAEIFPGHEVNLTRRELGEPTADLVWFSAPGRRLELPTFASVFGLKGAVATASPRMLGLARLIGWPALEVPLPPGSVDPEYSATARKVIEALHEHDVVCACLSAPWEASMQGDYASKIAALETIDANLLGPVLESLRRDWAEPGWRALVVTDLYALSAQRRIDRTPAPLAMAGTLVKSVIAAPFLEEHAAESDLHVEFGHDLMEYFLFSGLDLQRPG